MREYLLEQFSVFGKSDIIPNTELKEAFRIFLWWSLPSLIFVLWAENFRPEVCFYQEAIGEGIGPNLWNTIGAFGFFLFGAALTFSGSTWLCRAAKTVLLNTYAIGSLTFGLLLGQWLTEVSDLNLVWWKQGLFGITSGVLIVVLFSLNFAVWYLSFLLGDELGEKSSFRRTLSSMAWWRIPIGLFLMSIISFTFLIWQ